MPLNETSAYYSLNGTITLRFAEIQNITMPAGQYRVFKIDISSGNISMVIKSPAPGNFSVSEIFSINRQTYLEYGTCRAIESDLQETIAFRTATMNSHSKLVYAYDTRSSLQRLTRYLRIGETHGSSSLYDPIAKVLVIEDEKH